ncbi:MAG TPA: sulfatase-like hydrolase/transferase [Thermoguttaceae bacterium]|nr:sulfatase-like hydrolase/transferase [Thermoguttaceae bacterium]
MNAIVLVIDRLHAGYVGAYGNAWVATPSLDRLAVESVVFDQCLIESPRLESLCRSYWQGRHPLGGAELADDRPALPSLLRSAGVTTTLLTDEPAVARHPLAGSFDSLVELPRPELVEVAAEIDETHLAGCFARLVDWLESPREPFLVWCHLSGLGGPWDAPLEFRARYAEEDDPDPPDSAAVPCEMLPSDYDPDQLLGISQAYAGQVSLLDVCVGALVEALADGPAGRDSLFVLASARGFPLGEHRRVGAYDGSLYGELVHVPLWMRFPDSLGEAVRTPALVRAADLWRTVLDWWGIADLPQSPDAASLMPLAREEVESIRDRVCLVAGGTERAIRTPAWFLREAAEPELFAKPDDRWEVNDVADRCQEVVDLLRSAYAGYQRALSSGALDSLPPLDEILLTGLD